MNDLVWLRRESWEEFQNLLKNIQVRQSPGVSKASVHFTGTGGNSRIFLDLPEKRPGYDGMFKVAYDPEEQVFTLLDPLDPEGETAGYAYINGIYTEIPAQSIDLDESALAEKEIMLPDGTTATVKEGYVSLCLDPEGETSFTITPEVVKRVYDGEFCVEYNRKEDALVIVDGSNARGGFAGSVLCNGVCVDMPAGKLDVEEGTLCIALDASGKLSYKILSRPFNRIYDGEFAVVYDPESGLIDVVDGTSGSIGTAGHAFLNGEWKALAGASLVPREGYLCLRYGGNGVTYSIVEKPHISLVRWAEEPPEEETEE